MKFITPEDREPRGRLAVLPRNAREAIIEKEQARYTLLNCGHYTTNDVIEATSCWCPGKGKLFCEICGKWVRKAPKPARKPLPAEPMF